MKTLLRRLASPALAFACIALSSAANAQIFVNQPAAAGGGDYRPSQLWVDPGPNGNDLDTDAISYTGFTLAQTSTIRRIDWWGRGPHELGFRLEFWRQDPNTISYQPMGVFRDVGAEPDALHIAENYQSEAFGNLTHHWVDLPTPITLAANDSSNVRWFFSAIALTHQPNTFWDWAQGTSGTGTFYWIRGYHMFFRVGIPRAVVLTGNPVPEPATWACLGLGAAALVRRRRTVTR